MRVNIYEHEVTLDIKLVTKDERDSLGKFVRHMYGLRFMTGDPYELGQDGLGVPRSAVTFWSSERNLARDFAGRLNELQDSLDGA